MAFRLILLEYRIKHALRSFGDVLIAVLLVAGGCALGAAAMHFLDARDTRDAMAGFKQVITDEREANAKQFGKQVDKLTDAFNQVNQAKDGQIKALQDLNAAQAKIIASAAKVNAHTAAVAVKAAQTATAAATDVKVAVDKAVAAAPLSSAQSNVLKNTVHRANEKVR